MADQTTLIIIWAHLTASTMALMLGLFQVVINPKGDVAHKRRGWLWIGLMFIVTLPSFWMRNLNDGNFSWIHGLSLWVLFCMIMSIWSIRRGNVRRHAAFMMGTLIGIAIAGLFALLPGRFISEVMGYAVN